MTTEEKARAYDEALNKIKPLYEQAKRDGNPIWSTYEYLFPQLAESEDEKARKWIYDFIRNCPNETFEFYGGVGKKAVLAYLEKQKENTWSEEDDAKVKVMCEEGDLKPSERAWLKDLKNRVWKEQKPEWSEEDNKNLGEILGVVYEASCGIYRPFERDTYKRWESWLKSLRPSWKPSEEQMEALKNSAYGSYQNGDGPRLRELYEQLKKLM